MAYIQNVALCTIQCAIRTITLQDLFAKGLVVAIIENYLS